MPGTKTDRPTDASPRPAKRARVSKKSKSSSALDAPSSQLAAAAAACKVPKFLRSLYAILQTEDPRVIAWVQNQELKPNSVTAFHILEMERFEAEVLPKYFKHKKFASFQRQLNNFGFRKWTKTQSSGVCTFSHNCFPPDLSAAASSNLSIRDQWRQKSSQVIPPPTSVTDAARRRVVGNGIAKAKAKQVRAAKSPTARRRPMNVQVPAPEPAQFAEMYRSPNSSSLESNAYRLNSSHQPPLKKLARPSVAMGPEPLNGLEAFCDDSFKQFILPPLQPHHLLSVTPRAPTTLAHSFSNDANVAPSFGGFRYSLAQPPSHGAADGYSGFKYEPKQPDSLPHVFPGNQHNISSSSTDAALQGTFLEPWMWDAQHAASNFEIEGGPLPIEFDWQEGPCPTSAAPSPALSSGPVIKEECHQPDRVQPPTEEFGLDTLLFVE